MTAKKKPDTPSEARALEITRNRDLIWLIREVFVMAMDVSLAAVNLRMAKEPGILFKRAFQDELIDLKNELLCLRRPADELIKNELLCLRRPAKEEKDV